MSIADPNKTILTGENPFIRLSHKDGDRIRPRRATGGSSFRRRVPVTFSIPRAS